MRIQNMVRNTVQMPTSIKILMSVIVAIQILTSQAFADENIAKYPIYEDHRLFQPVGYDHPERSKIYDYVKDSSIKKYPLTSEIEFWFDPKRDRIVTSRRDLYIQLLNASFFWPRRRIYVGIEGRRIQVSKNQERGIQYDIKHDRVPKRIVSFGAIGAHICGYTGQYDDRWNIERPREEKRQCITNSTKFANVDQQNLTLDFVKAIFEVYGDPYSPFYSFGKQDGRGLSKAVFTKELEKDIEAGAYVE